MMIAVFTQLIGALCASMAAGVTFEIPRFFIFRASIIGALSYMVFLYAQGRYGSYPAYLIACIFFTVAAHIFARKYKAPVTIFLIPSFFLYVPGTSMYRMALSFIQLDYVQSQHYLIDTLSIAGIIAVGVFFVDSMVEIIIKIINHRRRIIANK